MKSPPANTIARVILVAAGILLPSLSLLVLGGIYLWENGYLLWWALASFVVVALVSSLEFVILRRTLPLTVDEDPPKDGTRPDALWSEVETKAWRDVEALAKATDIEQLASIDAFIALGHSTVSTVARRLHPEKPDAIWQFTLPEAMAIVGRVSRKLGDMVETHVPLGDRLTLAQLRSIYRWRGAIGVAERAYDVWRIARLANPATAVTHEARERLSRALVGWGREQITRRIAESYVEEVGRAAIDLYGGRLRTQSAADAHPGADASYLTMLANLPTRIIIAGADRTSREAVRLQLVAPKGKAPPWWEVDTATPPIVDVGSVDVVDDATARSCAGSIKSAEIAIILMRRPVERYPFDEALRNTLKSPEVHEMTGAVMAIVPVIINEAPAVAAAGRDHFDDGLRPPSPSGRQQYPGATDLRGRSLAGDDAENRAGTLTDAVLHGLRHVRVERIRALRSISARDAKVSAPRQAAMAAGRTVRTFFRKKSKSAEPR